MNDLNREHVRHIRYRWLAGESLGRIGYDYPQVPLPHLRTLCLCRKPSARSRPVPA